MASLFLNEEQEKVEVKGLTASDTITMLQVIGRLLQAGAIRENELSVVGGLRDKLSGGLKEATGVDFDAEVQKLFAQQRAQAEAAQKAQAPAASANDTEKAA